MNSTIPADLLELKERFEIWRTNRKYVREPMPDDLRRAALDMRRRYPPSLISRILKIDVSRLKKMGAKSSAPAKVRKKRSITFFQLPTSLLPLEPAPPSSPPLATNCRLQLERPDGSRLTLTLAALDHTALSRLCADFLRM
jgi:hypothetical protein